MKVVTLAGGLKCTNAGPFSFLSKLYEFECNPNEDARRKY